MLDEAAARRHAVRELAEEVGLDTAPEDLALWAATRGTHQSVGLAFLAPSQPASVLRQRFAVMQTSTGRWWTA